MITTKQALDGFMKYMDARILPALPVGKSVMLGGTVLLISRNPRAVEEYVLKKLPMLCDIGIYRDGLWDEQQIYDCYAPQIRGRFDIEIPIIGNISLDREEADALYRYLCG